MNVRIAFPFIILLILMSLVACGGEYPARMPMATPSLQPSPSSTPDLHEQFVQNAQMQETLNALQQSAIVVSEQLTATKMAPTWDAITSTAAWRATQDSATATSVFETTGTASARTATAESWTPTPIPTATPDFTGTLQASEVKATEAALHREAEGQRLALERQELMNKVYAVLPMTALVVVMGFTLSLAWRWSQVRVIQRDLRGDAPLIITGSTVYDADRNPGPVLDFSGAKPAIPTLTDPALQAATTSRDQAIDLVTRGTSGVAQRKGLAKQMAEPSQTLLPTATQIRVLPPEQARPLLGDVIPGIVRDAMRDELNEE